MGCLAFCLATNQITVSRRAIVKTAEPCVERHPRCHYSRKLHFPAFCAGDIVDKMGPSSGETLIQGHEIEDFARVMPAVKIARFRVTSGRSKSGVVCGTGLDGQRQTSSVFLSHCCQCLHESHNLAQRKTSLGVLVKCHSLSTKVCMITVFFWFF